MTDDRKSDSRPEGADDDKGETGNKEGHENKTPFGDLDQPSDTAYSEAPDFAEGADIRAYARDSYTNRKNK